MDDAETVDDFKGTNFPTLPGPAVPIIVPEVPFAVDKDIFGEDGSVGSSD